jgi:pilus assembly protein CpaC
MKSGLVRRALASATAALLTVGTFAATAQEAPVILTGSDVQEAVGNELTLNVGHSAALRSAWRIKRVSVANPAVADVDALETNELLVVAKKVGQTDLILWGENGEVWATTVMVDVDIEQLNKDLKDLFPRCTVQITRSQDVYFARGEFETADQGRQLADFLTSADIKYVDMTTVAGLQQVMLKVRVAEVNRVAIKNMGVNILKAGEDFFGMSMPGPSSGGAPNQFGAGPTGLASADNVPFAFSEGSVSPFNTLILGFPNNDLEFFVEALAENQYMKTLAEPTLVSLSGQEASFLAGGEFPIPVVQGTSSGGGTSITIEYKEFGIRLSFTPTVLGNGKIRLEVAPEVSELSDIGSVEIQGFRVPSIQTRRAQTVLEMNSGQTFSMAGLLNQSVQARNSRTPFLGDIPVLGSLFRSVSYQKGESELVVLVTPTLVEPLNHVARRPIPGDLHTSPNDWELFGWGKIEGGAKHPDEVSNDAVDLGKLEDLHGPGAWATYYKSEPATKSEQAKVKSTTVSGD